MPVNRQVNEGFPAVEIFFLDKYGFYAKLKERASVLKGGYHGEDR